MTQTPPDAGTPAPRTDETSQSSDPIAPAKNTVLNLGEANTAKAHDRIVVGIDGSVSSIAAFRRGIKIAAALDVPLEVVSAWSFPRGPGGFYPSEYSPEQDAVAELDAIIATVLGSVRPAGFVRTVAEGPAAQVLISESKGAGMLIVGSRGYGGFAGLLLGSVSSACAEHATCPVLIMHESDEIDRARDISDENRSDAIASATISAR